MGSFVRRLVLVAVVPFAAACATGATTVYLVRHAERPPGADPELNAAGLARAESLAVTLAKTKIDAVLHTQFKRTMQTARPLAAQKGLTPIVVGATGTEAEHAREVVRQIDLFKGKSVVHVGHSNTVPAVIAALGITPAPTIADTVYRSFFIVTRGKDGTPSLVHVKYGQ